MSDYIPFHIQVEIIKWLPVKSLLRFRTVSKRWKALISSSEFIASHSTRHPQPQHLLVTYQEQNSLVDKYVSIVDDDTFPQQRFVHAPPLPVEPIRIVGTSQGLFCLYGYRRTADSIYNYLRTDLIVLWNPSIRKIVSIGVPDVLRRPYETVLGFVGCPVTNDVKIVKISQYNAYNVWCEITTDFSNPSKVEVYTLSSGKWTTLSINVPGKVFIVPWFLVDIEGFNYWFASDRTATDGGFQTYIMSFDMTNENFRLLHLPDSLAVQDFKKLCISKLKDSLAVLEFTQKQVCAVWMMDHGIQKSFTKLFTISRPHSSIWTKVFWKGQPILQTVDDDKYSAACIVYEPDSEHIIDLGISGKYGSFVVNSYMETLLLLCRSDCICY